MNRILSAIKLMLSSPRNGDVFFADYNDFLCEGTSEHIFYPITDRYGHTEWHFIPGNNTYRFTIVSDAMPYYICDVELLVAARENRFKRVWLKRSRPRRIWKKDFNRLILDGRMVKTETESLYK